MKRYIIQPNASGGYIIHKTVDGKWDGFENFYPGHNLCNISKVVAWLAEQGYKTNDESSQLFAQIIDSIQPAKY